MAARLAHCLVGNRHIVSVNLTGNQIGDKGAERLARALQRCCTITELDLSGNGISVVGASWLAKALQTNTTLLTLILAYNLIETQGAEYLADAIAVNRDSQLARLDVRGNNVEGGVEARLRNMIKSNAARPPQLAPHEVQAAQTLHASAAPRPTHVPPSPPAYLGRLSILFDERGSS